MLGHMKNRILPIPSHTKVLKRGGDIILGLNIRNMSVYSMLITQRSWRQAWLKEGKGFEGGIIEPPKEQPGIIPEAWLRKDPRERIPQNDRLG